VGCFGQVLAISAKENENFRRDPEGQKTQTRSNTLDLTFARK